MSLFFSFDGRINRKPFWIAALVLAVTIFVIGFLTGFIGVLSGLGELEINRLVQLLILPVYYPYAAVMAKRLHDRNKPTAWVLPFLAPGILAALVQAAGLAGTPLTPSPVYLFLLAISAVVGIWALVELGFLKGTSGPNEYGPDPLGGEPGYAQPAPYGQPNAHGVQGWSSAPQAYPQQGIAPPPGGASAPPPPQAFGAFSSQPATYAPAPTPQDGFAPPPAQTPRREAFGQRQGGVYGAPPPAAGGPQPWSAAPPEAPAYPGQPNLYANAQGPADQGWKWLLFSVQGRINRQKFILTYLVVTVGFAVAIAMVAGIFGGALQNASDPSEAVPLLILFVLLYIPMIWIGVALSVKRWHDRDKSGWWVFIALIPIVGPIWAIVETLFLKGTEGPNRYGPDPLGNQLSDYAGQIG